MISEKVQDAIQILDYWFTMEFLSQNSYEMCTNAADTRRKLREYKKKLAGKQIEAFFGSGERTVSLPDHSGRV